MSGAKHCVEVVEKVIKRAIGKKKVGATKDIDGHWPEEDEEVIDTHILSRENRIITLHPFSQTPQTS